MRIVRGSEVEPTPWANGGGLTRELVDSPAAGDEPRWRLSMATCEGVGEFSSLPGVARTLMRVTGAIRLSFDGGDWVQLGDEDLGFRDTVVPGDEAVRLVPDGEATVVVVGR
ncbi:hypothetical protein GCM10027418_01270 [Mariniluteicoccus endophyticus]